MRPVTWNWVPLGEAELDTDTDDRSDAVSYAGEPVNPDFGSFRRGVAGAVAGEGIDPNRTRRVGTGPAACPWARRRGHRPPSPGAAAQCAEGGEGESGEQTGSGFRNGIALLAG